MNIRSGSLVDPCVRSTSARGDNPEGIRMKLTSISARHLLARLAGISAASLIALGLATGASASAPAPTDAVPVLAEETGAELYTKNCAKCHADDGKGETGMGKKAREKGERWPDLSKEQLPREKVVEVIKQGIPNTKMKAYGDKLTPAQIELVTDFVIGLRK
jgi:mono/diheme cytochrome c family protein